jgi:hypothetical protein
LDKIRLNDRYCLFPRHIIDHQFYSHRLLAALARSAVKMLATVIARTGGGGGFYGALTGSAGQTVDLSRAFLKAFRERIAFFKIYVFTPSL